MGCTHKQNQDGFTLVEISIVMIIIGLLIGGTFGGMKLIENMQVNKTVQDLKAIESAALTFRDTYGRLPGDIVNPAARLPNCTVAPCATGGNGNRIIGTAGWAWNATAATDENFTFWNQLQATDMVALGVKNTTDMAFGEGQPSSPIDGGYRVGDYNGVLTVCGQRWRGAMAMITGEPSGVATGVTARLSCSSLRGVDSKIDDGMALGGKFVAGWGCDPPTCVDTWTMNAQGIGLYDLSF